MKCFECGDVAEHEHHVVPKSKGGTKVVPLCSRCHGMVHDEDMVTWRTLHKEGIAKAKAEGRFTGRKKGSTKAEAERATQLKLEGMNNSQIAVELGVSRRTVIRYLKNA